ARQGPAAAPGADPPRRAQRADARGDGARAAHGLAARRHRAGRVRVQLAGRVEPAGARGRAARLPGGARRRAGRVVPVHPAQPRRRPDVRAARSARTARLMDAALLRRIGWPILLVAAIMLVAILAPLLAPQDPIRMDVVNRLGAPSWLHLLGQDEYGR